MGNDKEEAQTRFEKEDANTSFELGFEDEAWEKEKTNPPLHAMREKMREEKQKESPIEQAKIEATVGRGYYSLVMASNIVAGLSESAPLRTGLPSYRIWARATSARKQGWRVDGGLTHPKDDFVIPVRQVHRKEVSFVYLSDFVEWAIEAKCAVVPEAVDKAWQACEVSDTFERRVRLWDLERTLAELRNSKTEKTEVILARDAHIAELVSERIGIVLSMNGDEPEAERIEPPSHSARSSAAPSPGGEPCIRHAPKAKNNWYLVIRDAARAFHATHGRCPHNKAEMWSWLNSNPPSSYSITRGKDKGGEKALLVADGSSLGKRSFEARWVRYTSDTKEHKKT